MGAANLDSAVPRRRGRFCLRRFAAAKEHREHHEDGRCRRITGDSKERRNIQPRVLRRLPRDRRSNDHPIGGSLTTLPDSRIGKLGILHFCSDLEPLIWQNNREHDRLSEAELPPSIATDFLLAEDICCPFNMLTKVLRQEQPDFNGIGKGACGDRETLALLPGPVPPADLRRAEYRRCQICIPRRWG